MAQVRFDFRPFVNSMRSAGVQIEKHVTDKGVKTQVYTEVAKEILRSKGKDTGATEASISAIHHGESVSGAPYTNDKGITRYAYGEITDKGIFVDPIEYRHGEEYHYGEYSVEGYYELSPYMLEYDEELYNENGRIYNVIYDAVKKAIARS